MPGEDSVQLIGKRNNGFEIVCDDYIITKLNNMNVFKRILCLLLSFFTITISVSGQKKNYKDSIFASNLNMIISKQLDDFYKVAKKYSPGLKKCIVHLVFYEYNLRKKRVVFSIVDIDDCIDLEKFQPTYRFGDTDIIAIVKFPDNCDSLKCLDIKKIDVSTMQYVTSFSPSNILVNGEPYAYVLKIKNKRVKIKKCLCYGIDNINHYKEYNF